LLAERLQIISKIIKWHRVAHYGTDGIISCIKIKVRIDK